MAPSPVFRQESLLKPDIASDKKINPLLWYTQKAVVDSEVLLRYRGSVDTELFELIDSDGEPMPASTPAPWESVLKPPGRRPTASFVSAAGVAPPRALPPQRPPPRPSRPHLAASSQSPRLAASIQSPQPPPIAKVATDVAAYRQAPQPPPIAEAATDAAAYSQSPQPPPIAEAATDAAAYSQSPQPRLISQAPPGYKPPPPASLLYKPPPGLYRPEAERKRAEAQQAKAFFC